MMDYCVRESTVDDSVAVAREQTVGASIQETHKILREMNNILKVFASIVNGDKPEDKTERDVSSLWDESRLLVALAYENLQKLNEIKESII